MRMKDNLSDVYKVLTSDETLLRLLYYLPSSSLDDPLSTDKANILDMENHWDIINNVIMPTFKTDDLNENPKCRLMVCPGNRNSTGNYLLSEQEIVFAIFVHIDFDKADLRLSWICDRINELMNNKQITGIGKVRFLSGRPISIRGNIYYVGYELVYVFGSAS